MTTEQRRVILLCSAALLLQRVRDARISAYRRRKRLRTIGTLLYALEVPRKHGWGQELEVLLFIYCLAHGLSLSLVSRAFGVPRSTVHRVIHKIATEITAKLGTMITLPKWEELSNISQGFCQLAGTPIFEQAVGALDGCHIWIKPPGGLHQADYLNYKLFYSIHMQAICDSTGRFLDVFIGYPGSVHDARVLKNSPIFSQALYPPAGFLLLPDGGYPCLEKPIAVITPFKLPLRGRSQERYNRHHPRARSVVERAFGMMNARWRATFFKALEVSPAFALDIIACFAFLHNLCLKTNDVMEMEDINPEGDAQGPHDMAPGGQETSGSHIRERLAAVLSAPVQLPEHLQQHDYLSEPPLIPEHLQEHGYL